MGRHNLVLVVMEMIRSQVGWRRAVSYGVFLAAIWVVAAALRPTTTFHLVPLLIAAALPVALGFDNREVSPRAISSLAGLGGTLALGVTGLLVLFDRLRGPSLLPSGGAITESVVFAVAGTLSGLVIAMLMGRR